MALKLLHPEWKQAPIQGVLFDMDGVILDSEKLYTRFWQEAAQDLGYPMTRAQALGMRSLNREAGAAQLKRFLGASADYDAVRRRRIELMDAFVQENGIAAKPGIIPLLDALDKVGIPAAITTSSPLERIEAYLAPLGLLDRFQKICTGYQVPHGKPEPDIYLFGAASLNLQPGVCLALEDSAAGILSASRAGTLPVMIPDQDPPQPESAKLLYALADSLQDVIGLLDKTPIPFPTEL